MTPAVCAAAGLLLFAWGLQRRGVLGLASAGLGGWLLYEARRRSALVGYRPAAESLPALPGETEVVDEAIVIDCPPEILYSLCRDLANLRRLVPRLRTVEAIPPRHARWRLWAPRGRTLEWEATFTGDEPGRSIGWRTTYEHHLSHLGTVRFERAPDGRSALVAVQIEYLPPADAIGSAVVRAIGPSPHRLVRDALRRLKQIAESHDVVASDDAARPRLVAIDGRTGRDVAMNASRDYRGASRQPVQPEMNPGDEAVEGTPGTGEDVCPVCRGTGTIGNAACDNCGGTGKVIEGIGGA